ncbi:unnamed protein product [Paramecium pentaurelia]|uniref:Uncharacterized protein n=1 Tax=Paramecium pentaurelia TaxID=43138 RepID=A0A8S1YQ70_9CILI|nr:unnamed protein product [Paramecium pentaurelia]
MQSKRFDNFYIIYLKGTKLVIKINQLQKGMKSFKNQSNRMNLIIKVILRRIFLKCFRNNKMLLSRQYKIFQGNCLKALRVNCDKLFNKQYKSIFNSNLSSCFF